MQIAELRYPLIPTKLTPPLRQETWMMRSHLLDLLDNATSKRLILIVAPAGFGKSTLAAQWLLRTHATSPVAWLSLDEYDQDGQRVLAYLVGAVSRVCPGALPATGNLLKAHDTPPLYAVLDTFLTELAGIPQGCTLVLDDYHTVTAQAVHHLVAYLLRHLPSSCRLVLLSRLDPPLPLARLRVEGQLFELRAADLRFTRSEIATLLTLLEGCAPDPTYTTALHRHTEGWPIAIQLASLARPDGRAAETFPSAARRQLADYLAGEVLAHQPVAVQNSLPLLATTPRFCVELAAALLGAPEDLASAERLLEHLETANLFLIPLDEERRWYRFHHLFHDWLHRRLRQIHGMATERALQRRAAAWFAEAGCIEEAVQLYLAAGDEDEAAGLIERSLATNLGRNLAIGPPDYWLKLLPPHLIDRRPGLMLIKARISSLTFNIPALAAGLERVAELLPAERQADAPPPWPAFFGDLAVLRGTLAHWRGRSEQAIAELEQALGMESRLNLYIQSLAILGSAYAITGRGQEGLQRLQAEFRGCTGNTASAIACYFSLCAMHTLMGNLDEVERAAAAMAELTAAQGPTNFWHLMAVANLGHVAYERGDLDLATRHYGLVAQHPYATNTGVVIAAMAALATLAARQGDGEQANAWTDEARRLAEEFDSPYLRNQALALQALLALWHNDNAKALHLARQIGHDIPISTYFSSRKPPIIRAHIFVLAGDQADQQQAENDLAQMHAALEVHPNIPALMAVLANQALLYHKQGRASRARRAIEQAVALAAPRGYVQAFVDLGPAILPLLRELAGAGAYPTYIGRILNACGAATPSATRPSTSRLRRSYLLSRREHEILVLLAERWSNQEIAEQLHITINTVRKHTSTIYDKLGVSSRREAVAAARSIGLLADRQLR